MDQDILGQGPSAEVVEAGIVRSTEAARPDEPHANPAAAIIERGGPRGIRGNVNGADLDAVLGDNHRTVVWVAGNCLRGKLVAVGKGDAGEGGAGYPAR